MASRPRCIRCNRPIRDGEPRQSRMGATRRSYWHTVETDCVDTGIHRRRAPNKPEVARWLAEIQAGELDRARIGTPRRLATTGAPLHRD